MCAHHSVIEESLTQGKWLERLLWRAVAVHGGRFWHCQVTCLLPLHVHSWIPSSVKLDAGTRQRQRLISTFWGRAAAGSAVEPVGAGERRCALVRACAPPISFGVDGWGGIGVLGAGIGVLGVVWVSTSGCGSARPAPGGCSSCADSSSHPTPLLATARYTTTSSCPSGCGMP